MVVRIPVEEAARVYLALSGTAMIAKKLGV
jgi:hypothetical protein